MAGREDDDSSVSNDNNNNVEDNALLSKLASLTVSGSGVSGGQGDLMSEGHQNNETSFFTHNQSIISDDLFFDYPVALTDAAAACCVLFILIGIPGNILTILALARFKKVRNATAIFIINLSSADLMSSCFNLPLAASTFWNRSWIHGETLCVLFPYFRYGLTAVSYFTVLAITINRYIMIAHPRLYPRMYRTRHLVVMIVLIWVGAFGSLTPTLLQIWGVFQLDATIGSCSIVKDKNNRTPKEFLFLFAFVLPCFAIIVCYARIFYIVRKATNRSHGGTNEICSSQANINHTEIDSLSPEQAILRRPSGRPSMAVIHQKGHLTAKEKTLLWMIFVIFFTFVVCYLPITLVKALSKGRPNSTLSAISYVLIYATVCINPFIYCCLSTEYRQAYKSLILCTSDWNMSSRSNNSNKT